MTGTPDDYNPQDNPQEAVDENAEAMDELEHVYQLYVAFRKEAKLIFDMDEINEAVIDKIYKRHVELWPQNPFDWK